MDQQVESRLPDVSQRGDDISKMLKIDEIIKIRDIRNHDVVVFLGESKDALLELFQLAKDPYSKSLCLNPFANFPSSGSKKADLLGAFFFSSKYTDRESLSRTSRSLGCIRVI